MSEAVNRTTDVTNTRWANARRGLDQAHGFRPLRVEGRIPLDLRGTSYTTGPGVFERFGTPVSHIFEADGVITALRIARGQAQGAVRVVESDHWRAEQRAGRMLFSTNASLPDRVRNVLLGRAKNTGNTSMWAWRDRLFSLVESNLPTEIDPEDLSVIGETDFGGLLPNAFSAHPHRVAARRAQYNFSLRYGMRSSIDLFEFPDAGPARKLSSFQMPWLTIVHDFMVTRKHAVFVIGPARMKAWKALFQIPPFHDWFVWEPDRGCEIVVVPLDAPEDMKRMSCAPFWYWHMANAFDDGDQIHIDVACYDDLTSLRVLGTGAPIDPPRLKRMSIDLHSRRVRLDAHVDHRTEFPHVHPLVDGERHRFVWGICGDGRGRDGVGRVDVNTGKTDIWLAEDGGYVSEPIVAPRAGERETDAWLLTRVFDPKSDTHYTAILDAARPSAGPVAKIWHGQAVPNPFHGTWVPAR